MDRFNRIYALHNILINNRYPVSRQTIQEKLECSRATFTRIVEEIRDFLGAPIEYDRESKGYHYAKTDERAYELPGLWLNASELHALLVCQELLSGVEPGLLTERLAPLRARIDKILESEHLAGADMGQRIRILKMANKKYPVETFETVAGATLTQKRLQIVYHGRERDVETQRQISPQRMVYYRDNWYVDAFCHMRNGLRSFSISRIRKAVTLKTKSRNVPVKTLDEYFAESYGIFAGKPKQTAQLVFSRNVARWVACERWHPDQRSRFIDGEYELEIPYSDPRELILDISKYGPDVRIISPQSLRDAVIKRCKKALCNHKAASDSEVP